MNIYKSYIGRSVTHNRQSSFDIDLRICQFHGLKVMGVSVHQTDSYTNRYRLTNSVCCVKSEFVSAQVYSVWVSVRINYVSDKAIPACRLLVCKIDKNESVLFRYKVIYMKKGEKKATLYICHLVNRSFVSLFKSHGSLFAVLFLPWSLVQEPD